MPRIIAHGYGFVTIEMTVEDVDAFRRTWRCCPIPEDASYLIQIDCRTGDLVDMECSVPTEDDAGGAEMALCSDAARFAAAQGCLPAYLAR